MPSKNMFLAGHQQKVSKFSNFFFFKFSFMQAIKHRDYQVSSKCKMHNFLMSIQKSHHNINWCQISKSTAAVIALYADDV